MNEFLLIFRREFPCRTRDEQPAPADVQAAIKPWQDWINGMIVQNEIKNLTGLELNGNVERHTPSTED